MKAIGLQRALLGTIEKYLKNKPQGTKRSKNLRIFCGPPFRLVETKLIRHKKKSGSFSRLYITQTGKQRGFSELFKKNGPTSQVWNSRGPQMPLFLTSLSICHLWSYNYNFTCIDQSSPLWTKKTQVIFLKKKKTQELSLLFFLSNWHPSSFRFTEMNLMMRAESLSLARRQRHALCFSEEGDFARCTQPRQPCIPHSFSKPPCTGPSGLSARGWQSTPARWGSGCLYTNLSQPAALLAHHVVTWLKK